MVDTEGKVILQSLEGGQIKVLMTGLLTPFSLLNYESLDKVMLMSHKRMFQSFYLKSAGKKFIVFPSRRSQLSFDLKNFLIMESTGITVGFCSA